MTVCRVTTGSKVFNKYAYMMSFEKFEFEKKLYTPKADNNFKKLYKKEKNSSSPGWWQNLINCWWFP